MKARRRVLFLTFFYASPFFFRLFFFITFSGYLIFDFDNSCFRFPLPVGRDLKQIRQLVCGRMIDYSYLVDQKQNNYNEHYSNKYTNPPYQSVKVPFSTL